MTEKKTVTTAKAEKEALTGTTECRWCKEEEEYEEIAEIGAEVTTRCSNCSLKIWIRGDGWKKYKQLHDLEEGCQKDEEDDKSYGIVDWADSSIHIDETAMSTYNISGDNDPGVPLDEVRNHILRRESYSPNTGSGE